MSGPRRILIAHPSVELYGADRMLMRSAWALQNHGSAVLVTTPGPGPLVQHMTKNGLEVQTCVVPVLRKGALTPRGLAALLWLVLTAAPRQIRLLRRFKPDVMYVNTVTLPTWLLFGKLLRVKVICHVREAEDDAGRLMHLALTGPLRLADMILCNSRATKRFVSSGSSFLERRCEVLYNGLPLAQGGELKPTNGRRPSLVVVGRLSPRKGQDTALKAVGLLKERGLEVDLHLVGDAYQGYEWYVEELRALAAASGISDYVHFHGFVTSGPGDIYRGHDLALVPSRVEPFGNVAVEALGAGTPVIASSVQGLVEILEGGGGRLVPPDDPSALADAIADVLSLDPAAQSALRDEGLRQVQLRFSLARYDVDLIAALTSAN